MRIATYNIAHGADYTLYGTMAEEILPVDLTKLADAIRSLDADVIALNEVYERFDADEGGNRQTERLAALADYPYHVYAAGADLGFCIIGNAVLSRYPILGVSTFPVPAPTVEERPEREQDWFEDRAVLSVRISVEGKPLRVISTHFGLNPSEQSRMIATLLPLLEGEEPTVLLGDFNMRPDAEALAPLLARLTDAAAKCGTPEPTFSSYHPDRRIDYILYNQGLNATSCRTKNLPNSDHLPLSATLTFV